MTNPSLNERLAEKLGWTEIAPFIPERSDTALYGLPPGHKRGRHRLPDFLSYPGMGAVLEAMREHQDPEVRRRFCDLLPLLCGQAAADAGGGVWWLHLTPELVALAAVEALEGEEKC